eukprot:scaffold2114_cov253-Pinguiococcus_pyrenoidosus.AAC.38
MPSRMSLAAFWAACLFGRTASISDASQSFAAAAAGPGRHRCLRRLLGLILSSPCLRMVLGAAAAWRLCAAVRQPREAGVGSRPGNPVKSREIPSGTYSDPSAAACFLCSAASRQSWLQRYSAYCSKIFYLILGNY